MWLDGQDICIYDITLKFSLYWINDFSACGEFNYVNENKCKYQFQNVYLVKFFLRLNISISPGFALNVFRRVTFRAKLSKRSLMVYYLRL